MKKINTNEGYVTSQPVHSIISFVVVENKFPLSKEEHEGLEILHGISDIFFIFPNTVTGIDYDKFSSLYQACGFIVEDKEDNLGKTLFTALGYAREVFSKHSAYTFHSSGYVITSKLSENIVSLTMMDLSSPVISCYRLSSEEMAKIYKCEAKVEEEVKEGLLGKAKKLLNLGEKKEEEESRFLGTGRNKSHKTSSGLVFVPYRIIDKYVPMYKTRETSVEYDQDFTDFVDTFRQDKDIRYLLASIFMRQKDEKIIDRDIADMSVGDSVIPVKNEKTSRNKR